MIANDTNHAANERTFLAWIRAGLAAGAVVPVATRCPGLAMVVIGIAIVA
jgi:hypothetical protein